MEEVRRRVDRIADELNARFGLRSKWSGDRLEVRGKDIRGHIDIAPETVEVRIRPGTKLLPILLPIRMGVESAIDEHLS